jgi:hypothetical protein
MVRPEDIEKILTTQDLCGYLKESMQREDLDLNIDIDFESGELFMNCKGFSDGLSILVDTFGVWVIRETISEKNDGIFTQGKKSHHTENTVTVIRAVARWIRDIEESAGRAEKR